MHCQQFLPQPVTRREVLCTLSSGFGALALASLLQDKCEAGGVRGALDRHHHEPRARSVIFLYMDGGVSQVDSFDPKPRLAREHGKPFGMKMEATQFNRNGSTLKSPWEFQPHGKSGMPVSSLFPNIARYTDDLCLIRSMVSPSSEHTIANYTLHTGAGLSGRPSMGAWVSYGLGSETQDLPAFVVLNGGLIPPGGLDNFSSGFLSATHQGSVLLPGVGAVANIKPLEARPDLQRRKLSLIRKLDETALHRLGHVDAIESAIQNYELAARMQLAVPELTDSSPEPAWLRRAYGLEAEYGPTRIFGAECLLARRLVERGVRFVELTCPDVMSDRWDQHSDLLGGHGNNARAVDQPIGALLGDLKARGLLDSTLVVWSGEFGRTPFAQGSTGRDHNPFGFSIWLAGGGVRGGTIHGATDEYGYKVVEGRVEVHDLHATMLHLFGLDHKRLTFRFSGRDMRLTDVHGEVLHELLA